MKMINYMLNYLQAKPFIGAICAFVGAATVSITKTLTSDQTLEMISILSLYTGFFVGLLSGILQFIKLYNFLHRKYKSWQTTRKRK